MQDIEGLHVGPTKNDTWYTEEALRSSIPSWTKPYEKPLIMHHNDANGKIIGRIKAVTYKDHDTRSGTGALLFTCNVADPDGIEQIKDGRLTTVSVGVTGDDVRCSICGKQIELDELGHSLCGHEKSEYYDGEKCYWKVYSMEAKELSYVIVPSDIYAHNVRTYTIDNKDLNENYNSKEIKLVENEQTKNIVNNEEVTKKDEATAASNESIKNDMNKVNEEKIKTLESQLATEKKEKENIAKELERVNRDLAIAAESLDAIKAKLATEKTLKEAAEDNYDRSKLQLREAMEENLNLLRQTLNKPTILKESLKERSFESIKDSIADLKAEIGSNNSVHQIKEAEDVAIKKTIDVKESDESSNTVDVSGSKELSAAEIINNMFR